MPAPGDGVAPMSPLRLGPPLESRWTPRNSPADTVPSHGTSRFGSALALDLVPVGPDGATAPVRARSLLWTEPLERFPGFGQVVRAPIDGTVVASHDGEPDRPAHRGLFSVGFVLTQGRRAAQGWSGLAGNHVVLAVEHPDGAGRSAVFLALCHLRRGSLRVRMGEEIRALQEIGQVGSSGNSMEPHLHLQAMDSLDLRTARAVPFELAGGMPRRGDVVEP